ncbi:MAG: zinc-binding alcohol dehydrogenase [Planctomycetota bacterium]|nr:zinc-binding alcohol dehydrogenase [Planctomycetota bacterium]
MESTYVIFPRVNEVKVEREDLDTSALKPMEAIIRNETSIISTGTESARLTGQEANQTFPTRPGYGCIGRIVEKGAGITDFKIGDRVFYAGKHASVNRFTHRQDHQWGWLYPAREDVDPVDGSMVCMAAIAMTAPIVTELDPGDTVAVFGLGLVGALAAQLYKIQGARVIGLDPVRSRCDLARRLGIPHVLEVPSEKQAEAVKELTGGTGAHVAVDAVGHSKVIETCVAAAARLGQVILLGTPRAPVEMNVSPLLRAIHTNGLVVRGAHMWRMEHNDLKMVKKTVAWTTRLMFEYIADGRLNVRNLVSHTIRPEDVPSAYEGLIHRKNEYTAVVIDWR